MMLAFQIEVKGLVLVVSLMTGKMTTRHTGNQVSQVSVMDSWIDE